MFLEDNVNEINERLKALNNFTTTDQESYSEKL